MFDDRLSPASPRPPEDMFSGVDGTPPTPSSNPPFAKGGSTPPPMLSPAKTGSLVPKDTDGRSPESMKIDEGSHRVEGPRVSRHGFLKFAIVFVVVLAFVGGAAYAAYRIMVQQPIENGSIVQSVPDDGVVDDDTDVPTQSSTDSTSDDDAATPTENRGSLLDSDGDGLTNAEELEHGTLSSDADTDNDGLGDREEVEVYDTDPRDEDTDGDTYLDGAEVKNGYNPNGSGRLFEVPNAQ